jgi:hypothetical protein
MSTYVIPVTQNISSLSTAVLENFRDDVNGIILIHYQKTGSDVDDNIRKFKNYLDRSFSGQIEIENLNTSPHPYALGESFSKWLKRRSANKKGEKFKLMLSQETDMGYFVGLNTISFDQISLQCYICDLSSNSITSSSTWYDPDSKITFERLPLFGDLNIAKEFLAKKNATSNIFKQICSWYGEERSRFNEGVWFKNSDIINHASSRGQILHSSSVSNHLTILLSIEERARLIEEDSAIKRRYRITPLGRAYGWKN